MKLLVVRHSSYGKRERCLGRTDPPTGHNATVVAGRLNALPWEPRPTLVWSSPLRRCVEAARLLSSHLSAQLRIDERLIDADLGNWTGRPWKEIEREASGGPRNWIVDGPAIHGGESVLSFETRVYGWWNGLEPQACHALVAHDLVATALMVIARHCSWTEALRTPVDPSGLDVLTVRIGPAPERADGRE